MLHTGYRLFRTAVAAAFFLTASSLWAAPPAPPAPGGAPLVVGAESAETLVVGTIADVARVDEHGYRATLNVTRSLRGGATAGSPLLIAWEELARGRDVRFANGDDVIVALDALPSQSLWRKRFPPPDDHILVIAQRGGAFLRSPSEATLEALERWAAVARTGDGAAVATALARLAARAEAPIAAGAVARMNTVGGLADSLDAEAIAELSELLASATTTASLRSALLTLIGDRELRALEPAVRRATSSPAPLAAQAWNTAAVLSGGLAADEVAALLQSSEPTLRAVGVSYAEGTPSETSIAALIGEDASPVVRSAAVTSWIAWRGEAGLAAALPALFDSEPAVRGHAARAIGGLGEPVVAPLVGLLENRPAADALGPVAALAGAGPSGIAALRKLEASHPDAQVRGLVRLALGMRLDPH